MSKPADIVAIALAEIGYREKATNSMLDDKTANSTAAQDQEEYTARYNGYVDRYEKAKERYDALTALRQEKLSKAKAIDRFIATVSKRDDLLTEFDNRLWLSLVDYAEVHRDGMLTFHFFDGTEING